MNRIALTLFALATVTGATLVSGSSTPAEAGAFCPSEHRHWGKIRSNTWEAKSAARAGMRWKIRTQLGDPTEKAYVRGIRIEQCKYRNYGDGIQCQTSVVLNHCA